jgi:hypothetical protein
MNPGTDWIEQARQVLDTLRQATASSAQDGATAPADGTAASSAHSADCRWCPVCQVAAAVRGERPELTAALADVLTATATALRTFAEAAHPGAPADAGAAAEPTPETDVDPQPAVQRIDIA